MRRRALLLGLALGLGTGVAAATAETATLSLDSANSARLVLDHWPDRGWMVQQFDRLVEIRLPGTLVEVVPEGGLLDRLSGRVGDIALETTSEETILRLQLDCDCTVVVRGDGVSSLTLEVVGTPGSGAQVAALDDAPVAATGGGVPIPPKKPARLLELPEGEDPAEGPLDVDEARARLLEQLMRAAEAGIVDLEEPEQATGQTSDPGPDSETGGPEAAQDLAETQPPTEAPTPVDDVQAGASEPAERPTPLAPKLASGGFEGQPADPLGGEHGPVGPTCFDAEVFAFEDLRGAEAFLAALREHRAGLVGEFDRPNPDAALDLAKVYISSAMGPEARDILQGFGKPTAKSELYLDIAKLLDGQPVGPESSLRRVDCLDEQAIWRAYLAAMEGRAEDAVSDDRAAARAIERVPLALRQRMASIIGLAATEAGAWDRARDLEAMAERSARYDGRTDGYALLLSSRLAEWENKTDRAKDLLHEARASDPDVADKALLQLAEFALRAESEIGRDTADLRSDLRTLALLERGTPRGSDAFELEMRLLDREVQQEEMIDEVSLGVELGLLASDRHAPLISSLVSQPAMAELSRPLGLIYLENPERFGSAMEQAEFRRALARSLAGMGAPELAAEVLRNGDLDQQTTAVELAQAYLEAGLPREAMETARAITSEQQRARIQAEALLQSREAETADPILAGLMAADPDEANRALWEQQIETALADGDMDRALSGAEMLHRLEGNAASAERVAMFALDAGRDAIPDEARSTLEAEAPGRLAALEVLFAPAVQDLAAGEAGDVSAYLEQLEQEMQTIEGLIGDG